MFLCCMSSHIRANNYFCFAAFLYSTWNSINIQHPPTQVLLCKRRSYITYDESQSIRQTDTARVPATRVTMSDTKERLKYEGVALLRASPRCFQVYRTCREMVLSHVARNHITPAVVPIALDALEMRENRKFQRDRTEPFLSQKTLKEPHEISLSTWGRLICFHEIVDFFISGFTNSRLVALENSIHPQSQTSLPSKSPRRKKQKK